MYNDVLKGKEEEFDRLTQDSLKRKKNALQESKM
jgi:hypothetical protein